MTSSATWLETASPLIRAYADENDEENGDVAAAGGLLAYARTQYPQFQVCANTTTDAVLAATTLHQWLVPDPGWFLRLLTRLRAPATPATLAAPAAPAADRVYADRVYAEFGRLRAAAGCPAESARWFMLQTLVGPPIASELRPGGISKAHVRRFIRAAMDIQPSEELRRFYAAYNNTAAPAADSDSDSDSDSDFGGVNDVDPCRDEPELTVMQIYDALRKQPAADRLEMAVFVAKCMEPSSSRYNYGRHTPVLNVIVLMDDPETWDAFIATQRISDDYYFTTADAGLAGPRLAGPRLFAHVLAKHADGDWRRTYANQWLIRAVTRAAASACLLVDMLAAAPPAARFTALVNAMIHRRDHPRQKLYVHLLAQSAAAAAACAPLTRAQEALLGHLTALSMDKKVTWMLSLVAQHGLAVWDLRGAAARLRLGQSLLAAVVMPVVNRCCPHIASRPEMMQTVFEPDDHASIELGRNLRRLESEMGLLCVDAVDVIVGALPKSSAELIQRNRAWLMGCWTRAPRAIPYAAAVDEEEEEEEDKNKNKNKKTRKTTCKTTCETTCKNNKKQKIN